MNMPCVQIITLSDLEADLMNVRQCCDKLNQVCMHSSERAVVRHSSPDIPTRSGTSYDTDGAFPMHPTLVSLSLQRPSGCLVCVPVSVAPCRTSLPKTSLLLSYLKRQPGQLGIYDPLEINNRRNIKLSMRVRSGSLKRCTGTPSDLF